MGATASMEVGGAGGETCRSPPFAPCGSQESNSGRLAWLHTLPTEPSWLLRKGTFKLKTL